MFIPRQHLMQWAIDEAEQGNFSELATLMELVTRLVLVCLETF
jgi:uncharacterized protein YdiU (UPF0061 family)